jgi:hypothetical protein
VCNRDRHDVGVFHLPSPTIQLNVIFKTACPDPDFSPSIVEVALKLRFVASNDARLGSRATSCGRGSGKGGC